MHVYVVQRAYYCNSIVYCIVTESKDILEILVYFSILYYILFYFILFYDICSDMTGEHDTRINNQMEDSSQHWTSPEDGLLLGRTLRKEKKKIVHVSWENLYYLHKSIVVWWTEVRSH